MKHDDLNLVVHRKIKLLKSFIPLALAVAALLVPGLAPTAVASTPEEQINIIRPPVYTSSTITCGSGCLACCNCCAPGVPQAYLTSAYERHRTGFILGSFYSGTAEPALRDMATQFSQAWLFRARMIGGFYDAQNHHNAQLDLQKLQAEALRDYTPSEAVCQFGTLSRSLAATTERARTNQIALSEIGLARNLGRSNSLGGVGRGQDVFHRMTSFIQTTCDNSGNDNALVVLCAAAVTNDRYNRDVDYARTLAVPETLRIDFTNNALTPSEHDLILLGHNLYGNRQFQTRLGAFDLKSGSGQNLYSLVRSVTAKRAVAQNSFSAYAGMKAMGSPASRTHVNTVLTSLGMPEGDRNSYLATITPTGGGAAQPGNPSYYAQMDIMTKRIYQNPGFYAQLMDKKANVSRQQAAMEGLELMQGRDIFTSMSRSEQLLSVLVEIEAMKLQDKVQNNVRSK
jgi:hypothetical protein